MMINVLLYNNITSNSIVFITTPIGSSMAFLRFIAEWNKVDSIPKFDNPFKQDEFLHWYHTNYDTVDDEAYSTKCEYCNTRVYYDSNYEKGYKYYKDNNINGVNDNFDRHTPPALMFHKFHNDYNLEPINEDNDKSESSESLTKDGYITRRCKYCDRKFSCEREKLKDELNIHYQYERIRNSI